MTTGEGGGGSFATKQLPSERGKDTQGPAEQANTRARSDSVKGVHAHGTSAQHAKHPRGAGGASDVARTVRLAESQSFTPVVAHVSAFGASAVTHVSSIDGTAVMHAHVFWHTHAAQVSAW